MYELPVSGVIANYGHNLRFLFILPSNYFNFKPTARGGREAYSVNTALFWYVTPTTGTLELRSTAAEHPSRRQSTATLTTTSTLRYTVHSYDVFDIRYPVGQRDDTHSNVILTCQRTRATQHAYAKQTSEDIISCFEARRK
jgi:hypothetical protein